MEKTEEKIRDVKSSLSGNFKLLHSKLDSYEQLIGTELDRILTELAQATNKPPDTAGKVELQQLEQMRSSVFDGARRDGGYQVLGEIGIQWDILRFDRVMEKVCVLENSLIAKEAERAGSFAGCREGHLPGELHGPRGLSRDLSDNIYIADQYNKRIQIFSKRGEYLQHFGDEHLTGPWSVAVSGDSAYVTDAGQHGVFWFKVSESRLVKKTGGKGIGNGQFNVPHGIDVATDGRIYICDCFNDRITVLDSQLCFVEQKCEFQVIRPDDITVTDSSILVLDSNDPCLHVFNLEGVKILSIIHGVNDNETHMTKWGYFFAVNLERSLIVVSDAVNHCLRIFSLQGELVETMGQVGMDKGEFMTPQGVAILSDNRVVTVCLDKKSNMLQVF